MRRIHQDDEVREGFMLDLDEIAREGARGGERGRGGCSPKPSKRRSKLMSKPPGTSGTKVDTALVLRNGYANEREILLGAGSVALKAPRVNDKRMGRRRQPPELFRA